MRSRKALLLLVAFLTVAMVLLFVAPVFAQIGLTTYKPEKTCDGYTLVSTLFWSKLIDMEGNVIKTWDLMGFPIKMFPGGSVMGEWGIHSLALELTEVVQLSWEGESEWRFRDWDDVPFQRAARVHHDFQKDGNPVGYYAPGQEPQAYGGKVLVLGRLTTNDPEISANPIFDDVAYEVDWETQEATLLWKSSEHFEEFGFDEEARQLIYDGGWDYLHTNSMSRLGPNKWYDAETGEGDPRFHPDNLIMDSRQANIVWIVNMAEDTGYEVGEIVWKVGPDYSPGTPEGDKLGQIIGQHHAHMIPEGLPGEGNILVFDNGGLAGYPLEFRWHSRVLEFDPINLDLVWDYEYTKGSIFIPYGEWHRFFSYFISSAQRLPNGNTLIDEGSNERVFEVTPEGEIVWEFIDGFGNPLPLLEIYRAYRIPPEWVPGNPSGYTPWSELYE